MPIAENSRAASSVISTERHPNHKSPSEKGDPWLPFKVNTPLSRTQGLRRAAHASTKTHVLAKTKASPKPKSSSKPKSKKRRWISRVPKPRIIKRGKTTIRRYDDREFHRFEEVQGKTVDYAEVFTSGEYHSIAIYFQDKTLLHFTIDPGFTLETQYADMQTGDWRTRKRWPLLHSQILRA